MTTTITGWHFTGHTLRDGSQLPPAGEWLRHNGPIEPCQSGLHCSDHPFDALQYAPGNLLHRVELRGDLEQYGDPPNKCIGRERRIIATRDAEHMLRRFAKDQARQARGALSATLSAARWAARGKAWEEAWGAPWGKTYGKAWEEAAKDFARRVDELFEG